MKNTISSNLFSMFKSMNEEKDNAKWLQNRNDLMKSLKYNHNGIDVTFDEDNNLFCFKHRGRFYYV